MKTSNVWLLSLADLAFLLLIAHTQIATAPTNLPEVRPPIVEKSVPEQPASRSGWELFIHGSGDARFELVHKGSGKRMEVANFADLLEELGDLKEGGSEPPPLVPDGGASVQSFMDAHSAVVAVWEDSVGVKVALERLETMLGIENDSTSAP